MRDPVTSVSGCFPPQGVCCFKLMPPSAQHCMLFVLDTNDELTGQMPQENPVPCPQPEQRALRSTEPARAPVSLAVDRWGLASVWQWGTLCLAQAVLGLRGPKTLVIRNWAAVCTIQCAEKH